MYGINRRVIYTTLAALAACITPFLHAADPWIAPTPEELSMKSIPEVPGAAAVYLNREEITEDKLHMWSVYVRLKVLTEEGKKYANVELGYGSSNSGGGYTVSDIAGRTIHPDGTIIPFTGKPYEKLIEKTQGYEGYKHMAKVFTMPDVEVGSIIEYRYALRYDDHYFFSPSWYIQSELYTRKGHYLWKPTSEQLVSRHGSHEQLTNSIGWFPVLPAGTELKQTRLPPMGMQDGQLLLDLNVHDIPPAPKEEFMPPISSFTYRVLFYYSPYRSGEEYWKSEGKDWSKERDKFIGPGPKVSAAAHDLTAPNDTQEQKLHKLYAAVMQMENTDFTREHDRTEDKAAGLHDVKSTEDILDRKRGSGDQLTQLFVALARAAGMKAYVFAVTNRSRSIFVPSYLSMSQLDDLVAIVTVNGKDQMFDPGTRYCPYGHLDWKHTFAAGIRQVDGGTATAESAGEPYTASHVTRVADLVMDEHGEVTGSIKITFTGAPAIAWRHSALSGDETSLNKELKTSLEHLLPGGVEVKVGSIQNLTAYEEPFIVNYSIKGPIGAPTGKRLFLPSDIFVSNEKATFPHEKREIAVSFHYPSYMQDAVRIKFPASIKIESVPTKNEQQFQKYAVYSMTSDSTTNSVTVRRNLAIAEILFMPKEYPDLRSFYSKFESKDQENIVLTAAPAGVSDAKPAGAAN
ncbi:DUF3857 domain-containing protein [Edaphobacter flagellatus]|uniref:DUF3857 domain-containing protein n=1 Tax=Edaphobacter flagellatus TaxID=1933044 RepID=UPI0021B2392A|nr:DUF3857 domain-containing protein [Edaphobacter flagellatus]